MAFKFVNPGYPDLFDSLGPGDIAVPVGDSHYNPDSSVCIDLYTAKGYINIPNLTHVYASFYLYITDPNHRNHIIDVFNGDTLLSNIQFYYNDNGIDLLIGGSAKSSNHIYAGLHKCLVDVSVDGTTFSINFYVDGRLHVSASAPSTVSAITKLGIGGTESDYHTGYISNIIVADTDCSNEKIAICKMLVNDDGSRKVDVAALKNTMALYVDNAGITSLTIAANSIDYDSSTIDAMKETLNDTDIETKSINSANAVIFANMAKNPFKSDVWMTGDLANMTIKLTGTKSS